MVSVCVCVCACVCVCVCVELESTFYRIGVLPVKYKIYTVFKKTPLLLSRGLISMVQSALYSNAQVVMYLYARLHFGAPWHMRMHVIISASRCSSLAATKNKLVEQ